MRTLGRDISFGFRVLRKSPGFTAVVIITLALGIGANTAIFTLLDGLALRDLNVPHPEQLVRFGAQPEDATYVALSVPMFEQIEADQRVFSSVFAWSSDYLSTVEVKGNLSRHDIWSVTGSFYPELGGTPELGRLIGPQDDDLKAASPSTVAVLAYDFWQRQFGGDRNVIGKTLKIEGALFTVIGVTPPGFTGISADRSPEITIPLNAEPLLLSDDNDIQKHLRQADFLFLDAAGRLKNGLTLETARAQLGSTWPGIRDSLAPADLRAAERSRFLKLHLSIEPGEKGSSSLRRQFTRPLYILLVISGLVLLVTCINVAALMLSRTVARRHEIAVRIALGATRTRLLRQVFTESIMLSVAGTVAGAVLAYWWSRTLAGFILSQFFNAPAQLNLSPDVRVLLSTGMIAIGTGVLFGLTPAWLSTREDPNVTLQSNAKKFTHGTGRLGKSLIIAQISLSLVVLAVAGLFIRTLTQLRGIELGYQPRGVMDASLYPRPGGYRNLDWVNYYQELTTRISQLPGVESAGIAKMSLGWRAWKEDVRSSQDNAGLSKIDVALVMPGFFKTLGIDLEQGRSFRWQDDGSAPRVAIVSRSLARRLFGGREPIGQKIEITSEPDWQKVVIVGVVSDASLYDIRRQAPPTLYLALTQYGRLMGGSQLMLRTRTAPASSAAVVRETVESLGHEYVAKTHLIEETIDRSILRERLFAILSAFFGGLALLLAAVGLYGLMAYNVMQRTKEIGVRMALGATQRDVRFMILQETLGMATVGLLLGIGAALGLLHFVSNFVYGVSAHDPVTLAAVCVLLAVVAALAGWFPARKATKVDPMVALRHE